MDEPQQGQPLNTPVARRRYVTKSLKTKADERRSGAERLADMLTNYFGTITFLSINVAWFVTWIILNMGWIPGIEPFDPFPFGLLTMIVSLEAIVLAIVVLISQNRASRIADLREEIDLQINTFAEEEITKMIQLQVKLLEKNGVSVDEDHELQRMLRPIPAAELERKLEHQLNPNKHLQ